MTDILKIPANSQAYLEAIYDAAQDKFDVRSFAFGYQNAAAYVAHWTLDELSGHSRLDSGGKWDLAEVGGVSGASAGYLNNALHLLAQDTIGALESATKTTDLPDFVLGWTIQFYVYIPTYDYDGAGEITPRIFADDKGGPRPLRTQVYLNTFGNYSIEFDVWDTVTDGNKALNVTVTPDTWHLVTCWYDPATGTMGLKIDSDVSQTLTGVTGNTSMASSEKMIVGDYGTAEGAVTVLLDEVEYRNIPFPDVV